MSKVYLFDVDSSSVVAVGQRTDGCVVVSDESMGSMDEVAVIDAEKFYLDDRVQDVVPQGRSGTQVHVECMNCGFETVYGVRALIQNRKYGWTEQNGYPKRFGVSCNECGESAWKEVERQSGTCDWSDSFDWAEPPEQ